MYPVDLLSSNKIKYFRQKYREDVSKFVSGNNVKDVDFVVDFVVKVIGILQDYYKIDKIYFNELDNRYVVYNDFVLFKKVFYDNKRDYDVLFYIYSKYRGEVYETYVREKSVIISLLKGLEKEINDINYDVLNKLNDLLEIAVEYYVGDFLKEEKKVILNFIVNNYLRVVMYFNTKYKKLKLFYDEFKSVVDDFDGDNSVIMLEDLNSLIDKNEDKLKVLFSDLYKELLILNSIIENLDKLFSSDLENEDMNEFDEVYKNFLKFYDKIKKDYEEISNDIFTKCYVVVNDNYLKNFGKVVNIFNFIKVLSVFDDNRKRKFFELNKRVRERISNSKGVKNGDNRGLDDYDVLRRIEDILNVMKNGYIDKRYEKDLMVLLDRVKSKRIRDKFLSLYKKIKGRSKRVLMNMIKIRCVVNTSMSLYKVYNAILSSFFANGYRYDDINKIVGGGFKRL